MKVILLFVKAYLHKDYQRKCLPCIHGFEWIFLYHLESCDSINFRQKNFLTLYCLITWNENHALILAFCYRGRGDAPQNDSPPKSHLPPKIFEKTIERTIEKIVCCFEKQWSIVFCPSPHPYIFSSRKPDYMVIHYCMESHNYSITQLLKPQIT